MRSQSYAVLCVLVYLPLKVCTSTVVRVSCACRCHMQGLHNEAQSTLWLDCATHRHAMLQLVWFCWVWGCGMQAGLGSDCSAAVASSTRVAGQSGMKCPEMLLPA